MPRPKKATTPGVDTPKPVRKRAVRAKPVEPPPVQELAPIAVVAPVAVEPPKRKWKETVDSLASVAILACAVCFLGAMAATAFIRLKGEPNEDQTVVIDGDESEQAAALFIEQYKSNLSKIYSDAAKQTFKDLAEARDFIKPRKDAAEEQAFKPLGDQLESINGDKFDPTKAKVMFEGFAKGLVK